MSSLSWHWMAVAAMFPPLAGALVAYPIWRWNQPLLGNLAGTIIIFGSAIALIMREHVELDWQVQACLDQGFTCWPEPAPFTRYAIYASIALVQVMALFSLSLRVEQKLRRRGYAPEWR